MPTPVKGYFLKDGSRVPGTTTVISNCKIGGIEGLLYWANQEGLAGRNYRETRDAAADAGTCAHDMVECDIRGSDFDKSKYKPETLKLAEGAFKAYRKWAKQTKLKAVAPETRLVSETHKYGGTLDAMLVDGELALGDWKTSNSVRADYLIQLAAYRNLWEENHPDQIVTGGFHLLKFSKPDHEDDPVHFSHHHWSHLDLAWDAFQHMRALYDLSSRLKKLAT